MEVAHGRAEGLLHDWVDAVEVLLTTRAHTVTQVLHAGRVRDKSFKHSAIFNRLAHGISECTFCSLSSRVCMTTPKKAY